MKKFDAIVIGAGIIGAATSYYLAKKGLKVAIVDKEHPASGTSGACNGGLSYFGKKGELLAIAHESLLMYKDLARDLNYPLEICQNEQLVQLAVTQDELLELEKSVEECVRFGLDAEMIDRKKLHQLIPGLSEKPIGAAVAQGGLHGFANPFTVVNGYLAKVQELGGILFQSWEVKNILSKGGKVEGVANGDQVLKAPIIVICAGVEAIDLLEKLKVNIDLQANRGVVLVTEIVPWNLQTKIMGANFGSDTENIISLCIEQSLHGNLLVGSSHEIGKVGRQISSEIIAQIAKNAVTFYPPLASISVIRAFTGVRPHREEGPFLGEIDSYPGMYAALGHGGMGITLAPWTGRTMAEIIC